MPRGFLIAGLGLAAMATAQTPINMPPFVSTYVAAATRGFYFFCPTNCVITGLQAPNEASQPNQVVEVLDLGSFSPPLFPAAVTPTAQLFYSNSVAAGTKVNTSIALQAGRYYGIFGCCTDAPGSEIYNLQLSEARALSVKYALVDAYGIPERNLVTAGYGEEFLKVLTEGPEQLNRRVTLRRITPLVSR